MTDEKTAEDQAPAAAAAQEAQPDDMEQRPSSSLDRNSADTPLASSAPPAERQSGVPFPEDDD